MARTKIGKKEPTPVRKRFFIEKGEVRETTKEKKFEWEINNFFPESVCNSYSSPSFSFNLELWFLQMIDANKFYNINLCRECNDSPITVELSVALKTASGEKNLEGYYAVSFEKERRLSRPVRCLSKSELVRRKDDLIPSGVLTIVCSLRIPKSTESARDESLSEDFRKMLFDGRNHDLVLKIGEKEFRVHKDVLMARSQVFRSMLTHDMAEKNRGVIDMPDCDPQAMSAFLSYVYSGKVETLDQTNMAGLYYIADKYEIINLQETCCSFIKMHISPTNFCEVIKLALNHSDSSLLEVATEYFIKNMLYILRTVEWQCFLKDYPSVANELLIKSCESK